MSKGARIAGILCCVASIIIHATTVTLIGTIAAVIAALAGLAIALTPLGRRLTGRDLMRKLRVEGATAKIERSGQGSSSVSIDMSVRNESDIAISQTITAFDISWGESGTHPLRGEPPRDDVFERQPKTWQAPQFTFGADQLPTTITIDYTIEYGRLDKRATKRLTGQRSAKVENDNLGPRTYALTETHPDQHKRIKRKDRKK